MAALFLKPDGPLASLGGRMNDDMKLTRERERGISARRLLEDPLFKEAGDRIDAMLVNEWRSCTDPDRRERIWVEMKIHRAYMVHFAAVLQTGQLADKQLGQMEEAKKRGFWR